MADDNRFRFTGCTIEQGAPVGIIFLPDGGGTTFDMALAPEPPPPPAPSPSPPDPTPTPSGPKKPHP